MVTTGPIVAFYGKILIISIQKPDIGLVSKYIRETYVKQWTAIGWDDTEYNDTK